MLVFKKTFVIIFLFLFFCSFVISAEIAYTEEEQKAIDAFLKGDMTSENLEKTLKTFNELDDAKKKDLTQKLVQNIYDKKKTAKLGLLEKAIDQTGIDKDSLLDYPKNLDLSKLNFENLEFSSNDNDETIIKTKNGRYLNLDKIPKDTKEVKSDGENLILVLENSEIVLGKDATNKDGKLSFMPSGIIGDQVLSGDLNDYKFEGNIEINKEGFTFGDKDSNINFEDKIKFGGSSVTPDSKKGTVKIKDNILTLNNAYYSQEGVVNYYPQKADKDFKIALGNDWSQLQEKGAGIGIAKTADDKLDIFVNYGEEKNYIEIQDDIRLLKFKKGGEDGNMLINLAGEDGYDLKINEGGIYTSKDFSTRDFKYGIDEIQTLDSKGEIVIAKTDDKEKLAVGKLVNRNGKMSLEYSDKVTILSDVVSPVDGVSSNNVAISSKIGMEPQEYVNHIDAILEQIDDYELKKEVISGLASLGSELYTQELDKSARDQFNEKFGKLKQMLEKLPIDDPNLNGLKEKLTLLGDAPFSQLPSTETVGGYAQKIQDTLGLFDAVKSDLKALKTTPPMAEMRIVATSDDLLKLRNIEGKKFTNFGQDMIDNVNFEVQMLTDIPPSNTLNQLNELGLVTDEKFNAIKDKYAAGMIATQIQGALSKPFVYDAGGSALTLSDGVKNLFGEAYKSSIENTDLYKGTVAQVVIENVVKGGKQEFKYYTIAGDKKALITSKALEYKNYKSQIKAFTEDAIDLNFGAHSNVVGTNTQTLLTLLENAQKFIQTISSVPKSGVTIPTASQRAGIYAGAGLTNPEKSVLAPFCATMNYQIPSNCYKFLTQKVEPTILKAEEGKLDYISK